MKKLFTLLLILCGLSAFAQNDTTRYTPVNGYGYTYTRLKAKSALVFPADTVANKLVGSMVVLNDSVYVKTAAKWESLGTASSLAQYVKYADTAAMLAPYARSVNVHNLPAGGTIGQILAKNSATNYDAGWIDNYTEDVRETVKAGEAISKGQAVYVSSADGTNVIVSKASNTSEATSSKTLGLLYQNLALNDTGFVITDGKLSGINTTGATAGDPVWLGANGNLLFGMANKPVAPLHMVYLGVVTRVNANNGEIMVKVQNGFEVSELHDVVATNPANNDVLYYDSATSLWKTKRAIFPADTAAMLAPYARTIDVNAGLASKLNISDTAAMLSPYVRSNVAASTYVPYTGATKNVNLGQYGLNGGYVIGGDTSATTYNVQGASFTPYVLGRKAVTNTLSGDPRTIGVLGQTIARGSVANRLVGGAFFTQTDSSNSQNISQLRALQGWTIHNGTGTVTNAWGSYNVITNSQTGTITNAYGSVSGVENRTTGYIPKLHGQSVEVWNLGGGTLDTVFGQTVSIYNSNPASTIGAAYGVSIGKGMITTTGGTHYWRNSGTIGTSYGLYLDTSIDVGINKYAIYSFSRSNSYFNGKVGIGINTPDSALTVAEGALFQRGVRMSGLLPGAGTKALRIDAIGNITYSDTLVDAGGTVTSIATNTGTGITGGTITTTGTLAIDTLLISTRAWRQKGIDSVQANLTAGLATKVNISDTATMLSPYARTNVVNASLATKLNISDTATMLTPYLRKVDTTAMLSPYLRSNVASATYIPQSRTITINGTAQDLSANRSWSVGTVTSVGSGYGLSGGAITGSGTLLVDSATLSNYYLRRKDSLTSTNLLGYVTRKVLADTAAAIRGADAGGTVTSVATNNGTGITGGTITTTGTLAIDTLLISTRAWRQKGIDSVASLITGGYVPTSRTLTINGTSYDLSANRSWSVGTVTSVGTNTGTGITGGTITGSGTIAADTLLLSTRAWRQKGIDSVAALANTKISGTGTTNYIPKFTGTSSIGNSALQDDGSTVTITSLTNNVGEFRIYPSSGTAVLRFGSGSTEKGKLSVDVSSNMIFETGGSERMRLDASGNLGLGTSSPTQKLHVSGSSLVTGKTYIGTTSVYLDYNSGGLDFATSGVTKATLDASGNLGLGVTPSAWYSLSRAIDIGAGGSVQGRSNAAGTFEFATNAYLNTAGNWTYKASSVSANLFAMSDGSYKFYTAPSGTAGNAISFTQAMTLDASGRLGIGTTSPSARLAVHKSESGAGAGAVLRLENTGTNYTSTMILTDGTTNDALISYLGATQSLGFGVGATADKMVISSAGLVGIGTTSPNSILQIKGAFNIERSSTTDYSIIDNEGNLNLKAATGGGGGSFNTVFFTGGSERMRITSGGNVLVGTSTDGGYKLQVNGASYMSTSGTPLTLNSTSNDVWLTLKPQTGDIWRWQARTSGSLSAYNETLAQFALTLTSAGNTELYGAIKTAAPSGYTAKSWKLGERVVTGVTFDATQYIAVEIDGTTYYLATVTID